MRKTLAAVAQSVERVIGNDEVGSSNLPSSSKTRFILSGIDRVFVSVPYSTCRPPAPKRSFIYEAYSILPGHLREAGFQPMLHQFRSVAARFAEAIADNGTDL